MTPCLIGTDPCRLADVEGDSIFPQSIVIRLLLVII